MEIDNKEKALTASIATLNALIPQYGKDLEENIANLKTLEQSVFETTFELKEIVKTLSSQLKELKDLQTLNAWSKEVTHTDFEILHINDLLYNLEQKYAFDVQSEFMERLELNADFSYGDAELTVVYGINLVSSFDDVFCKFGFPNWQEDMPTDFDQKLVAIEG